MKRTNLAAVVTAVLAVIIPATSNATLSADPVFTFGVLGSYSKLKFEGHRSTDTEHMPEGGLFLNFGNKMTARTGLVFSAEISGQYSERQNQKVKDGQADLDLGWRFALDAQNYLDLLLGGGYKWNRFDPDYKKYETELTSRTPFAKAAIGYNHLFSASTLRLEAGVRKTLDGDAELNIHGVNSSTVDLKDTTNPFVELSWLMNQQGAFPLVATLYFNRFKYDLDGQFKLTDYDKQTRDEYGLKIGIVF